MRSRTVRLSADRSAPLTEDQYNDLVEKWNRHRASKRHERTRVCDKEGHNFREAPIGTELQPVDVCVRCLKYVTRQS